MTSDTTSMRVPDWVSGCVTVSWATSSIRFILPPPKCHFGRPWFYIPTRLTLVCAEPVQQEADFMALTPKSMADFGDFVKFFSEMKLPAMPNMDAFVSA